MTCTSNRRLTFSSILSIAIAIAVAVSVALALALAVAVALALAVAVALALALALAVAARYDTVYYTLYPMYSGVAPNSHGLARSACRFAHTYQS